MQYTFTEPCYFFSLVLFITPSCNGLQSAVIFLLIGIFITFYLRGFKIAVTSTKLYYRNGFYHLESVDIAAIKKIKAAYKNRIPRVIITLENRPPLIITERIYSQSVLDAPKCE